MRTIITSPTRGCGEPQKGGEPGQSFLILAEERPFAGITEQGEDERGDEQIGRHVEIVIE